MFVRGASNGDIRINQRTNGYNYTESYDLSTSSTDPVVKIKFSRDSTKLAVNSGSNKFYLYYRNDTNWMEQ
jgi:hypothetical protein